MRKKLFAGLTAAAVAVVMMVAGVAYAVTTYRAGTVTTRQYVATSTDVWLAPGPGTWQTVPATTVPVTISGGNRLITARFGAESLCTGPGWCSVRIVYTSGSSLVELAPQSGTDYAFDSDGDQWDQHTVERTSATWLPPGSYRVLVQAMRVSATQFRLDDYHLNVSLIAP